MILSKSISLIDKRLKQHFGIPKRNPNPPDPVDLLIGTILSQNTNDKNSYRAYQRLKQRFPDWNLANLARRTSIEKEIRVAGLGKQKSQAIKYLLKGLQSKYRKISLYNILEETNQVILEELTAFKGIGVKTASCVLLFALGRNICPVDTHVHRTINRIGIISEKTPEKSFYKLNEKFPSGIAHSFHTNLIRLGREICKPKNPGCGLCPLLDICRFENKNMAIRTPASSNSFMLLDEI